MLTRAIPVPSAPRAAAGHPGLLPLGAVAAGFGLFTVAALAQVPPAPPEAPAAAPEGPAGGTVLKPISVKARQETDANSVRATSTTVGRGHQELRDIPQGVTVVTQKLLEDRRTDTVKEALHHTGGITFQAAEGGEEDIRLRGFSLTASGDIYVDGVRDPAFYDRDVFNFDRIELLRGSASMLFGRGSTGGVVNQVSKQPFLADASQVDTTAGTGSYLRFAGDFNIKLSETSAARLNVMKTDADNHGVGIDKFGVAPTLRWGIGTDDEFSAGYFHLDNDNGIQYGIPWLRSSASGAFSAANPAVLVPIDPRNHYGAASDYNAGSASYGTLSHTRRFAGGARWHSVLRHGTFERDQRASAIRFCVRSATANLDCPAEPPTLATFGPSTPLVRGTNNKVQDLTATYLQSDYTATTGWFGRKHDLLAGVDLAREEFNNHSPVLPAGVVLDKNTPRATFGNPNDGTRVDESLRQKTLNRNFVARALGVYAQDLVEVAPHWKVLGGLRWDRFSGDYASPATTAANGTVTPDTERSRSDSLWSQRFGVIWQPDERSSYYASCGTSFNTSGELYNYDAPGAKAPPEKSRNIEVGAKLNLFEGRLSARGALFHSTKTNERNRDSPSGQPIEDYLLSGRRHATGVDIDVAGRITRRWEMFVSYTWIPSARIDEAAPNGTLTGEQVGDRPSLTPRHSGSIFTTYQLTPELRLGAGVNARSAQTPNRNPAGIVAPGFATLDLLAEYAVTAAVALKLNVINATDRLYADSLYTGHYIPGQARTVYLSMTARF